MIADPTRAQEILTNGFERQKAEVQRLSIQLTTEIDSWTQTIETVLKDEQEFQKKAKAFLIR